MLGRSLADPQGVEGQPGSQSTGLGLLDVVTVFQKEKHTYQARLGLPDGQDLRGYEIHSGETSLLEGEQPFGMVVERSGAAVQVQDGARSKDGRVWGTYLHDIFSNDGFRQQWLRELGWLGTVSGGKALREKEYDRLADVVQSAVDWVEIKRIMGLEAGR
jgi:adenosylcobyric acid synthase